MHELQHALSELRELARGIHPAILTDQGLARRSPPWRRDHRSPSASNATRHGSRARREARYLTVAEALANVASHAQATAASVSVSHQEPFLVVEVRDEGSAAPTRRGKGSSVSPTGSARSAEP